MNNKKLIVFFMTLILTIVIGFGIVIVVLLVGRNNDAKNSAVSTEETTRNVLAEIGTEVGIITNENQDVSSSKNLTNAIAFTTEYQREIYVTKGHDASCYIGNSSYNYYDNMYIQIMLDSGDGSLGEEIYLSKIIPRGSHIESFTLERDLEPGVYYGTLIHAVLNDEGELINNTPVVVEITVSD